MKDSLERIKQMPYDWANREKEDIVEYANRVGINYIVKVLNTKKLLDLNKQIDSKIEKYL